MVALCDCNNFFVSCQRLFRPDLENCPVLVLSGNDGCVIARSNETKALGIKMGVPVYQVKDIIRKHNITLFSANHRLYSDISQRVMATLRAESRSIEVYSIDEAFLDLGEFSAEDYKIIGEALALKVKKNTGIPVSLGVAPTKTLAKIASKLCKQYPALKGCCVMQRPEDIKTVLSKTDIDDIWGIGRNTAAKLSGYGVFTAQQFADKSEGWVRYHFNLPVWRTWKELRGESVIDLHRDVDAAQSISIGRSFAKDINDLAELKGIARSFASVVAAKLRVQGSCVSELTVYMNTNRHREDLAQHNEAVTMKLDSPTDSTLEIVRRVVEATAQIYRFGYGYKKLGVVCSKLVPKSAVQISLFDDIDHAKHNKLMMAIDKINGHLGKETVRIAGQVAYDSGCNQQYLSPQYTTKWSDLPRVSSDNLR